VLPQHDVPPLTTRSAACPFLFHQIPNAFVTGGASAARARTDDRQARPLRHHVFLALEVVVEVVHLPLDAVGIAHPELVLVGVAAVDAHLLPHREAGRLDAGQLRHHGLDGIDLHTDVIDGPRAVRATGGQREVDRCPLGQELDVALLHLRGVAAQELFVEVAALGQIRDVHVQMDLCAHCSP